MSKTHMFFAGLVASFFAPGVFLHPVLSSATRVVSVWGLPGQATCRGLDAIYQQEQVQDGELGAQETMAPDQLVDA